MKEPKPTFEQCLDHIETTLGHRLLDWQKDFLYILYENPRSYVIPARYHGKRILNEAIKSLNKLLETKEMSQDEILEYLNNYGLQQL